MVNFNFTILVSQKVLLPRIAWCSKLRTLFWGRSLALSCVPFECSVIVSASSACGQAEGKKVLVQVLSGTAPRGTIRGRLFNRGLVRKRLHSNSSCPTHMFLVFWFLFARFFDRICFEINCLEANLTALDFRFFPRFLRISERFTASIV